MNWTVGFNRLRRVGLGMLSLGVLFIALGQLTLVIPIELPALFHSSFGIPLIVYGVLLWALSWVGEGFTRHSSPNR